ncbi:MAG: 23S rRNA (adenine(2030)-N(6))-methyltransferase RlmJ [Gammaproteobacteria bacterium]
MGESNQSIVVAHKSDSATSMNYRHLFHAGNFADVFKHIVLVEVVLNLLQKPQPFCYMDTHAGVGAYDLYAESALKTTEAQRGITQIWSNIHNASPAPPAISRYLDSVRAYNQQQNAEQRFYPGSPEIVRALLRPQDKMILTELHPEDAEQLKTRFKQDARVAVHQLDGYQALKAFLPPKNIGRGLVLIDPPFEREDEWDQLLESLLLATTRWKNGRFLVWYPIKDQKNVQKFYRQLKAQIADDMFICEWRMPVIDSKKLSACGVVMIRPPWQFAKNIKMNLEWLASALKGRYRFVKLNALECIQAAVQKLSDTTQNHTDEFIKFRKKDSK